MEIDAAALDLAGEGGPSPSLTLSTLRWASRPFTTDANLDIPPATPVEGRLEPSVTLSRELSADAETGYSSTVDFAISELVLENTDRGLDDLPSSYAVTGREIRVFVADWSDLAGDRGVVAGAAVFLWDDGGGASVAWDDGGGVTVAWEDAAPTVVSAGVYDPGTYDPGTYADTGVVVANASASPTLAAFGRVFRGRVTNWSFGAGRVTVRVEPDARKLDSPLLTTTYDGSGDLGGSADLAGRSKPRALGRCRGVEPVLIDPVRSIYQIHDGGIASIPGVRDEGVDLALLRDYGSYAELRDAVQQGVGAGADGYDIGLGQFATCLLNGVFRVGGPPAGRLIADVNGAAQVADVVQPWADGTFWADGSGWTTRSFVSYASGARHIIQHLLTTDCGFDAEEVDSEGIDHLNGRDPDGGLDPSSGLWLPSGDGTTGRDAVKRLAQSAGCVAFQDRDGVWRVRYLEVAGTPVLTLDRSVLVPDSFERLDLPYPQPWSTWKAAWDRNWTPLTATDLAGGDTPTSLVDPDVRAFSTRPAAYAQATDPALDLLWPQGRTGTLETVITNQADALQRVQQMFALYGRGRGLYRARWEGVFGRLEFMDVVTVSLPQLGMDGGVDCLVVGLTEDGATRQTETILLGGQVGPTFQLPPTLWLSQGPARVQPSTSAATPVSFVLSLSAAQTSALRVPWTLSGLAAAQVQGGAVTGVASIPAGATSGTITVTLAPQTLAGDLAASLKISAPPGATLGTPASLPFVVTASAVVGGGGLPTAALSAGPASATASSTSDVTADATVALSAAGAADAVIAWSVSGLQPQDVLGALSGTLTIPAGSTSGTVPLTFLRQWLDTTRAGTLSLSAVSGCVLGGPASASFSLTANFAPPTTHDIVPLGPADLNLYWRTKANGDASITQLATGATFAGGTRTNRLANGTSAFSRAEYGPAFTLSFSTKRNDALSPAGSQTEIACYLLLCVEGRQDAGHERWMATWTDTAAVPNVATYANSARGLLIPLHLTTSGGSATSHPAAAYWLQQDGSLNALSPATPRTFANVQGTTYAWTVTKSGQTVTVAQGGTSASWTSPKISTHAPFGAVGFLVTAGRSVDITAFHATAGTRPSLGGLLAQASLPGRWPTAAVTYGFPDAGFGWVNDTHPFGFGSYGALSSSWSAAPAAMRAGFRAAAAAWASATGIPLTEKPASSAQVLVAVSSLLPGASSLDGIGNPPPNGSLFVSPALAASSWAAGGYAFQLALSTLGQAAFGLHAPPSGSVANHYSLSIMASGAASAPRWWPTPRQADIDAALIDYDRLL